MVPVFFPTGASPAVTRAAPTLHAMELDGKNVVVTGAAGGIGSALVARFHAAGARVVASDLASNVAVAEAHAARLNVVRSSSAVAVAADVATESGNRALVEAAEATFGPIDLFFANAGVAVGRGLETPEAEWQTAFDVNVHAHRWAAKYLLPGWLARGEGYFCSTASAAGLLSQIGSAPYALTKHAAVAFAEWLSITHGDAGLKVSCLCPQGVNTAMLRGGDTSNANDTGVSLGSSVVRAAGKVLEPDEVAEVVLAGIQAEAFLILPHPEVLTYLQRKTGDYDRWLSGMRKLQARMLAE